MEETEVLIRAFDEYQKANPKRIQSIVEEYLTTESYSVDFNAFLDVFPAILYSLYDFILASEMLTDTMRKTIEELGQSKNYTALTEELIHIWTCGAIPLLIQWEDNPKKLSRKILVPLRMNMSDIMYAALSTLRSNMKQPVLLESGDYSFLSGIEEPSKEDGSFSASDYPSFTAYGLDHLKLVYGYSDAWVFHLKPSKLRILDHEKSLLPMMVTDAVGYGIIDDSLELVREVAKDPLSTRNGVMLKDMLGVNFNNADLEELTLNAKEGFYMTQYRYEAGTPLVDEVES